MAERDPESGALTVTTGTGSLMQNPMLRVALSANSCCLISFSSRRFFIASSSNEHQYLLFDMRTSCRAFYQSDQPAACKLLLVV